MSEIITEFVCQSHMRDTAVVSDWQRFTRDYYFKIAAGAFTNADYLKIKWETQDV